jgi:hypothetical protein
MCHYFRQTILYTVVALVGIDWCMSGSIHRVRDIMLENFQHVFIVFLLFLFFFFFYTSMVLEYV